MDGAGLTTGYLLLTLQGKLDGAGRGWICPWQTGKHPVCEWQAEARISGSLRSTHQAAADQHLQFPHSEIEV